MKNEGAGAYVRRAREDTQRYVQDLLDENDKLRRRVAGLKSEAATLETEKSRLEARLARLREELESDRREHEILHRRLAEAEGQSHKFAERYVEIERQNTNLANLYVASYSLHGTLDRQEVLAAIQEIIINLVGCEELGIFELDPEGSELLLSASFGIDAESYRSVAVGSGSIGRVARSGETYLAGSADGGPGPEEAHLTACFPLRVEGRVTGVIATFRLLPQKVNGLGALDHELFELLATQAGAALYCTALHARAAAEAASEDR